MIKSEGPKNFHTDWAPEVEYRAMKKGLIAALIGFVVLAGYFIASPYIAANSLKEAIASGDKEMLDKHIDFPVLRQDIKDQINATMIKKAATELEGNLFSALAASLASTLIDSVVDDFITPSGLSNLINEKPKDSSYGEDNNEPFKNAKMRFTSHDKFEIKVSRNNGEEIKIYLYRHGLSWKLSKIQLPIDDM